MSDADGADWPPVKRLPRSADLPDVNVGDTIRIIEEGKVEARREVRPGHYRLSLRRPNGRVSPFFLNAGMAAKVEILEPEYVDGEVYRDADGEMMRWNKFEDGWEIFGNGRLMSRSYPSLPVERIGN